MPDEHSSQNPTGNPEGQPPTQTPTVALPQQSIIASQGEPNSNGAQSDTKRKLHWLEIGYFFSQIGLAVIGIGALTIYHGQLNAMKDQLGQMQKETYVSCVSAQIARSTLLEIESGSVDSHNLAVGSITQADAVTRAEAAFIRIDRGTPVIGHYENILVLPFNISNVGQSIGLNIKANAIARIERLGEEPDFKEPFPAYNALSTGSIFPVSRGSANQTQGWQVFISDKDGKRMTENDPDIIQFLRPDAGGLYLSIHGRLKYQDAFGVRHWTQFCYHEPFPYRVETTFRFTKCAAYNKTDVNSVPKKTPDGRATTLAVPPEVSCAIPPDAEPQKPRKFWPF